MNHEAIYALYPTVRSVDANGIAKDTDNNVVSYDLEAVNAWVKPIQYKEQRAAEYPSYADQFDTIFHEGIDAWKAQIQAVKDKYPKV
jgi:hypothetical protein